MVGRNYKRPDTAAPRVFRGEEGAAQQVSLADLRSWEVVTDRTLKSLIEKSIRNNYDLRIAINRVEPARQIALQDRSLYYPTVDYQGNVSRGRNTFLGAPVDNSGSTEDSLLLAFTAAWEIDFWGRLRRTNESARAQFYASEEFK